MTLANDLVQFLMHLFGDRQAAQDFLDNPEKVLEDHGLGKVCSADVDAAMPVVLDYAPVTINASRFDREYNTGGNRASTDDNGGGGSTGGGNHGGGHHGGGNHGGGNNGGGDDHAHAVQQLHHVVNNYSYTTTVDDRDTITDQSVNQNIWADGDVTQYFDNDAVVASGDRAIAAGDDADVEDSNNIEDSYNTDNSTDNSKDSSINAGGDVNIGNTDIDANDSFNTELEVEVEDSFNDNSDNREDHSTNIDVRDSGNDNSINDSFNEDSSTNVDVDAHLENIGNTDNSLNDSFNDNSDRSTDVDVDVKDSFQDNSEETNTTISDNTVVADNTLEYTNVSDNVVVADNELTYTEDNSFNTDVNIEDNEVAVAGDDAFAG